MQAARSLHDFSAAPWTDFTEPFRARGGQGTSRVKMLHAPDGKRVGLINNDGEARPHFHTKASSFFVLSGAMILRDKVAGPGTWGLEPYGAVHPRTLFENVTYGLGMAEGDFGVGNVMLERVEDVPAWATQAGFKLDDYATLGDTAGAAWLPFGDGLSIKVIHVFDSRSAFASLIRAEAGARLPARRYLGPADFYILEGKAQFGDVPAGPGTWAHYPAGAEDGPMDFPVATEFLANQYGAVMEFDEAGRAARVIDGFALRELALVRTDGQPVQAGMAAALARCAAAAAATSRA